MPYTKHIEIVPMSVVEAEAEGEFEVAFEFRPGTPESGRFNGPPEDYDPGEPDEFVISSVSYAIRNSRIPTALAPHEEEKVIEWLDENWERPE